MNDVLKLVQEIRILQEKKLLKLGQKWVPFLTSDDVLQPNDFPELDLNPHFRYEEGTLHGIQSVEMALQCLFKEKSDNREEYARASAEALPELD